MAERDLVMSSFHEELLNHLQAVGIAYAAWKGQDTALAGVLAKALATPDRLDEIRRHLHSKPLAAALSARDIALWVGHDALVRLVDQTPGTRKAAALRVQHHPGANTCRYCLLTERQSLQPELQPEVDAFDAAVAGSFTHRQCAVAWARLRQQVAAKENT